MSGFDWSNNDSPWLSVPFCSRGLVWESAGYWVLLQQQLARNELLFTRGKWQNKGCLFVSQVLPFADRTCAFVAQTFNGEINSAASYQTYLFALGFQKSQLNKTQNGQDENYSGINEQVHEANGTTTVDSSPPIRWRTISSIPPIMGLHPSSRRLVSHQISNVM